MSVLKLAAELKSSGWPDSRKLLILAARYYKGLESEETLRLAGLNAGLVRFVIESR